MIYKTVFLAGYPLQPYYHLIYVPCIQGIWYRKRRGTLTLAELPERPRARLSWPGSPASGGTSHSPAPPDTSHPSIKYIKIADSLIVTSSEWSFNTALIVRVFPCILFFYIMIFSSIMTHNGRNEDLYLWMIFSQMPSQYKFEFFYKKKTCGMKFLITFLLCWQTFTDTFRVTDVPKGQKEIFTSKSHSNVPGEYFLMWGKDNSLNIE